MKLSLKMRKILVVDDTESNLAAAREFFSKVEGYEFVYATNRKDAEVFLEDAYAIITDRSIPSNAEVELFDCEIPEEEVEMTNAIIQTNGYYLLLRAFLLGKPAVMAAEHGKLGILFADPDQETEILKALLDNIARAPSFEHYLALFVSQQDGRRTDITRDGWQEGVFKTQPSAWAKIWTELQQKF